MQARIGWLDGVVVATETGFIRFDPTHNRNYGNSCIFISHAHSDHVRGLKPDEKGYLTAETRDILSKRYNKEKLVNFIPVKYDDEVAVDGLDVSVRNSGHVLGSAQYVIRDATLTVVYTGDINCREMLTTTAAETISCDVLILETTYGNPAYVFPSLMDIYVKIINWAIGEIKKGRTPTFVAYSVGKSQEIVKIFNNFTNIPVVTSHSVSGVNEVYDKNGVKLNYVDAASEEGKELLKQPCIHVVSPSERATVLGRCSFATATGWALRFGTSSANATFPLSCHADFGQLVNYVKNAKPREVFTVHGFKEDFANYISRKFGIRASEIRPIKQSSLRDFI